MIDLRGLGYLGLTVPDRGEWTRFATDVVGLMPAPAPPPANGDAPAYFKCDDRQWRVAVHEGPNPGIAYVGFELASEADFRAACAHLEHESTPPVIGTEDDAAARGVRELVHVTDPSGTRIELYWGPTRDGGFASPVGVPKFVTGELGMGHYVLLVSDLERSMDFYQRVLGLRLTDYVLIGPGMSVQFLRCTPRHHSVALTAVGPIDGLHHVAFEVTDVDQVGAALERATRADIPITATLGRHKNDRMLSFYMRSPAGFEVEVGCDGLLVDDDRWVVNHFTGGDDWGHHGLTGDAMAASVADATS